jgi:DNA-binding NtrC family response regulator
MVPGAAVSPLARARFRAIVQSPLRAGLVRFLHARQGEWADVETLMERFGTLRLDVENCLRELVANGLVRQLDSSPPRFAAAPCLAAEMQPLLADFLSGRDQSSSEDLSPSAQRFREMIGRDEKMMLVFESIRTVAKPDLPALVLGPTGSGKEVVARMVHDLSARRGERFQAVNCAALPDTLFESELFGYERGAFTGAHERKPGRIELADRGTLFLDEIGDLALLAQAKLLRVTEERRVERLGGRESRDVDFRLICATNQPLDVLVRQNRFREDLYYRVNAFTIRLPSLRERPVDIAVLAERFLARYCASQGLPPDAKRFSPEALRRLTQYSWPGNIRELETTVPRAALSSEGLTVEADDIHFLHAEEPRPVVETGGGILPLREVERRHIERVLAATGWNKKKTARLLEISRETLYRKIADYRLTPAGSVPDLAGEPGAMTARDGGRRDSL